MNRGAALLALVAALAGAALPARAEAPACRQALALALDVSGSVDRHEYRMQLDGLAGALLDPEVQQALLQMPEAPVWLTVFEWSGQNQHRLVLRWTEVTGPDTIADIAATLRATQRQLKSQATGLGSALVQGGTLLAQRPGCWQRTLDVSADGESNDGPRPREVKGAPVLAPVTINALVIGEGDEVEPLARYFKAEVLRGPGAFVEAAQGYADYQAAMTRKLLRELMGLNVARAGD